MFEEAAQFAVHLRRMEADIKRIQDDAESALQLGFTGGAESVLCRNARRYA